MTITDDDSAQYAALEAEMSKADPELRQFEAGQPEPDLQRQPTPQEYDRPRHAEPSHQQHHGQQQTDQRPPQQQHQQYNFPSAEDDPIGHFSARAERAEAVIGQMYQDQQQQRFWDGLRQDEQQARAEFSDYDDATDYLKAHRLQELAGQFPDNSREAQVIAHRHGYQSPAHLRQAILMNDTVTVTQHAFANNISPAQSFYQLAQQRGFRPRATVGKTQERMVADAIKFGDDKTEAAAWDWYTRQMRAAEEVRD